MTKLVKSRLLPLVIACVALSYAVYEKLTIQQRIDQQVEVVFENRVLGIEKEFRVEVFSDAKISSLAELVVKEREEEFVKFYFPHFRKTFLKDSEDEKYMKEYTIGNVKTFEELCIPVMQALKNLLG